MTSLPQRLASTFNAGWSAHKASLDSRNAKGLRAIEENAIADASRSVLEDMLAIVADNVGHEPSCAIVRVRKDKCDCQVAKTTAALTAYCIGGIDASQ